MSISVQRPSSLFAISIQRDQLFWRKLKRRGINPAAAILVCSYFSHLRFCFCLSLTFLNANQLNFSLLGVGYHAFLFVQKIPTTHIICQNEEKNIKCVKDSGPGLWSIMVLHLLTGVPSLCWQTLFMPDWTEFSERDHDPHLPPDIRELCLIH